MYTHSHIHTQNVYSPNTSKQRPVKANIIKTDICVGLNSKHKQRPTSLEAPISDPDLSKQEHTIQSIRARTHREGSLI